MRVAVILFSSLALGNCLIFSPLEEDNIDAFVNTILSCRDTSGFSIAVVKGDETWTKAYGKADVERGRNSTDDTLFCIGSITKSFTSTILTMLMEQNPRYILRFVVTPFKPKVVSVCLQQRQSLDTTFCHI